MEKDRIDSLVYIPCYYHSIYHDHGFSNTQISFFSKKFEKVFMLSYGPNKIEKNNNVIQYSGSIPYLLKKFKQLQKKENIVYVNISDIFIFGFIGSLLGNLCNIPVVARIGGLWKYRKDNPKYFPAEIIKKITKPFVLKKCERIVVNAKYLKNSINCPDSKIKVVYNGVDTNLFSPEEKDNQNQSDKVIFVGSLTKRKGVDILAEASLNVKESFEFTFVGDGPLREKLEKNYPHITFTGKVEHKRVSRLLKKHDIIILPSFSEGFPNVLLEGMACGLGVIATNVSGIPEMIDHKKNGLLINPGSKKEIINALNYLEDKNIRKKLGANARKKVLKNFRLENQMKKLGNFLFENLHS